MDHFFVCFVFFIKKERHAHTLCITMMMDYLRLLIRFLRFLSYIFEEVRRLVYYFTTQHEEEKLEHLFRFINSNTIGKPSYFTCLLVSFDK
jgi:hypothetical protein